MAKEDQEFSEKELLDELFETVVIDGQFVPVGSHTGDIEWLDMDLAQSGQDFFQNHYASIVFAHSIYFGLGFGFKPITEAVMKTGGFKGLHRTTKRLVATIWHVLSWYEQDLIGTYAKGTKAISTIRCTHDKIRQMCARKRHSELDFHEADGGLLKENKDPLLSALESDLSFLDMSTFERMDLTYDPPTPMSNFSMVLTQVSFLLPVFAHPEAFGIYDTEGLEGFEHLWALIGKLLGIEDRFNIPLHRPGKEFYIRFWKEVFVPSFLVRDPEIKAIQDSYYKSSQSQMSVAGNLYYFCSQSKRELPQFGGEQLYKLMSWTDLLGVFLMRVIFALFGWSTTFKELANRIVRSYIHGVLQTFAKEEKAEGREFTFLPRTTRWTQKYRKRDENLVYKWKKWEALVSLMIVRKKLAGKHGRRVTTSKINNQTH